MRARCRLEDRLQKLFCDLEKDTGFLFSNWSCSPTGGSSDHDTFVLRRRGHDLLERRRGGDARSRGGMSVHYEVEHPAGCVTIQWEQQTRVRPWLPIMSIPECRVFFGIGTEVLRIPPANSSRWVKTCRPPSQTCSAYSDAGRYPCSSPVSGSYQNGSFRSGKSPFTAVEAGRRRARRLLQKG